MIRLDTKSTKIHSERGKERKRERETSALTWIRTLISK